MRRWRRPSRRAGTCRPCTPASLRGEAPRLRRRVAVVHRSRHRRGEHARRACRYRRLRYARLRERAAVREQRWPGGERFSDPDATWGHRSAISTRKGGDSTATGYTWPWTPRPTCRSRGAWSRPTRTSQRWSRRSSTSSTRSASGPRRWRWTRATTLSASTLRRRSVGGPDHPAAQDPGGQARRSQAADVRARRVAVRRGRLQAAGDEVALPDRRMLPRLPLGQGRPPPSAHPARDSPLPQALQAARRRRARVRTAQARLGTRPAPRPRHRPCTATRRPYGAREVAWTRLRC